MKDKLIPIYINRDTSLHRAKVGVVIFYLISLTAVALFTNNLAVLVSVVLSLVLISLPTKIFIQLKPFIILGVTLALFIALLNPIFTKLGVTLLVRGPVVPVLGEVDVTLEALVYGVVLGLKGFVMIYCAGIYTVAVNPDKVLRALRQVGFHSALTASVATRMVPQFAADAVRIDEAQLSKYGSNRHAHGISKLAGRAKIFRALLYSSLDRSLDVAMALDVKGFGRARPNRGKLTRIEINDFGFFVSAALLSAFATVELAFGFAEVQIYPRLGGMFGSEAVIAAAALVVISIFPVLPYWLLQLREASKR